MDKRHILKTAWISNQQNLLSKKISLILTRHYKLAHFTAFRDTPDCTLFPTGTVTVEHGPEEHQKGAMLWEVMYTRNFSLLWCPYFSRLLLWSVKNVAKKQIPILFHGNLPIYLKPVQTEGNRGTQRKDQTMRSTGTFQRAANCQQILTEISGKTEEMKWNTWFVTAAHLSLDVLKELHLPTLSQRWCTQQPYKILHLRKPLKNSQIRGSMFQRVPHDSDACCPPFFGLH